MKKIKLNLRNQKNYECLAACLKMVLDYYDTDVTEDKIIKSISHNSFKLYDWEFKAGKMAIDLGLKAQIFSNVSYLFDPSWSKLSREKLTNKLKRELAFSIDRQKKISEQPDQDIYIFPNKILASRYTKEIEAAIKFLEVGGRIKFNPVSKKVIKNFLDKNTPIIISLNPALLHRMERAFNNKKDDIKGITWGHVLIVSGHKKDNFIVSDPDGKFYKNKLEYEVNEDLLLESFLRYNGQMLVVNK